MVLSESDCAAQLADLYLISSASTPQIGKERSFEVSQHPVDSREMSFHHPFLQRQPTLFPLAVQRAGQAWGGHTPINRRCAVCSGLLIARAR
ncbi:hypothetical protein WJX72_005095 [[Myrmecia] bisecta]|uniref:Uncharacterized protein n=1 Tax=[Myrmecia] bisecta TaxID=41462 RepID=A0AAW1PD27_9CHLO